MPAASKDVLFPSSSSSEEALFSDESLQKGLRKVVRRPGQLKRSQVKRIFQISSSSSSGNTTPDAQPVTFDESTGLVIPLAPANQTALPEIRPWPTDSRTIDFSTIEPQRDAVNVGEDRLVCGFRESLLPPLGKYTEPGPAPGQVATKRSALTDAQGNMQFGDPVDYIILFVHGIGGRDQKLEKNIGLFRQVMHKVKKEHFWDVKCEMHIELINWKQSISTVQTRMFERILPPSSDQDVTSFRNLFNNTMADLGFYMTPVRKDAILNSAGDQINAVINKLKKGNPRRYRDSKLILIGYSLGSVIVHDLLDAQSDQILTGKSVEMQAMDVAEPGESELKGSVLGIPVLATPVHAVYLFGSPLASFVSMRATSDQPDFDIPVKITNFYNIFHELDPIAFRLEPLFYRESAEDSAPPVKLTGNKEENDGWFSKLFKKSAEDGGALPRSRRLDFMLPSQSTLATLPLIGKIALPVTMLPAHYIYWHDERVAYFLLKTLTAAQ